MKIKCVCYDLPVSEIASWARRLELKDINSIKNILRICNKCQLCNPYIQKELDKRKEGDNINK